MTRVRSSQSAPDIQPAFQQQNSAFHPGEKYDSASRRGVVLPTGFQWGPRLGPDGKGGEMRRLYKMQSAGG